MMRRHLPLRLLGLFAACLAYLFILGPLVITAAVSFNEANKSAFPPVGFSLRWWREAFGEEWMKSFVFSIELGVLTALITTVIALPLAFATARWEFPGKKAVQMLSVGPLFLPHLVLGIALLQFLSTIGLRGWIGFPALLIGHVVICLPFSLRTILISIEGLPHGVERAAASLGAVPMRGFIEVTLPLIMPGIGTGMIFSFINSFDDVNMSIFLASPTDRPISVQILGAMEFGFSPTLAALSIMTLLVPLLIIMICGRWIGIGDFMFKQGK